MPQELKIKNSENHVHRKLAKQRSCDVEKEIVKPKSMIN